MKKVSNILNYLSHLIADVLFESHLKKQNYNIRKEVPCGGRLWLSVPFLFRVQSQCFLVICTS